MHILQMKFERNFRRNYITAKFSKKWLETLNISVLLNIFDQKSSFRGHFQIFSWSFVVIQLNNRQPIRIARLVKNSFFLRTSPEHEILNFLVKFFVREWKIIFFGSNRCKTKKVICKFWFWNMVPSEYSWIIKNTKN